MAIILRVPGGNGLHTVAPCWGKIQTTSPFYVNQTSLNNRFLIHLATIDGEILSRLLMRKASICRSPRIIPITYRNDVGRHQKWVTEPLAFFFFSSVISSICSPSALSRRTTQYGLTTPNRSRLPSRSPFATRTRSNSVFWNGYYNRRSRLELFLTLSSNKNSSQSVKEYKAQGLL